jgi:CheY-like chemotaxis protein
MRGRLAFWCARAGGLATSLTAMGEDDRATFWSQFETCDVKARAVGPQVLYEAVDRLMAEAGAPAGRKRSAYPRPTLTMDVGGPGWEGIAWEPAEGLLFVPGAIAPPVGDEFTAALRLPGQDRPVELKARVEHVRTPEEATPGAPAGFEIHLQSPPPVLVSALAGLAVRPEEAYKRAAPRYPVKAPVKVSGAAPAKARPIIPPPPPAAPATARIEYATDQELADDWLENLSQGGAFVRSASPAPIGSQLTLEMRLPGGLALQALSTVVFANDKGMGVKFELDARGQEVLATAMARITGRPRRALVVEGDAEARAALAEALTTRGFEVLTTEDGESGLHVLAEELLTLDLLVTGLDLPGMRGEAFVRAIRLAGGESDLAIVVATNEVDEAKERRLADLADAVIDTAVGAKLVAEACDAALERKRDSQGGD